MIRKLGFVLVIILLVSVLFISGISNAAGKDDLKIDLDKNLMKQPLGVVVCWYAYAEKLKAEVEKDRTENDKEIKISFENELAARTQLVEAWKEANSKNVKNGFQRLKDVYLEQLEQVYDNKFLSEYVYHFLKQDYWEVRDDLKNDEFIQWAEVNLKGHKVLTLAHIERK